MNRRGFLASLAATSPAVVLPACAQTATHGLPSPVIKDVTVIATAPAGLRLSVVKISTDQDGLYGYGCATFTQRAEVVNTAVEKYLRPFLIGKRADRIEDIWQSCYDSSYWRNGPVLNNAISGVDQALWDIKRGRHLLHPRGRSRDPADHRPGPQVHGAGIPPRARAGGRAGHGGLWRGAWRGRHHRAP